MPERLNCPNCGAPITGTKCEYCGSLFLDFGSIEIGKPMWLRIKHNGELALVHVYPTNCRIKHSFDSAVLYADSMIADMSSRPRMEIELEFQSVPSPVGTLYAWMEKPEVLNPDEADREFPYFKE